MAALLFAGCAKETSITTGDKDTDVSVVTNYLTLNLISAKSAGTRIDPVDPDDYQNGEAKENKVNMIRFFFFDDKGNAAPAWKLSDGATFESFIDWYPAANEFTDGDPNKTIEKVAQVTLGINIPEDGKNPALVLAVVNPSPEVLAFSTNADNTTATLIGPSLEGLRGLVYDFKTGLTGGTGEGGFVMSNSVYVSGLGTSDPAIEDAVSLENKYKESIEAAQADPVVIYVERVLARLDLSIEMTPFKTFDDGKHPAFECNDDGYKVDDKEQNTKIYVKFLGWNVTTTTSASRLVKSVSTEWGKDDIFGGSEIWNTSDYFRSFWAINPAANKFDYQYGIFNPSADDDDDDDSNDENINPANLLDIPVTGSTTVYLQENAAQSADEPAVAEGNATKVIIAAQLVDAEGNYIELAEWAYKKYTLENLKTVLAGSALSSLYKKNGDTAYDQIEDTDIDFTPAKKPDTDGGNYYVYATLAEDSESAEWCLKGADGEYTDLSVDEVKSYMRDRVNHVMVWTSGYTYYYFDIQHLGTEGNPGYLGVVRNHLYKARITSVKGLGTPVYDPDHDVIYPEKPEYDESLISAQVNILQWRIVSQGYELEWE